MLWTILTGFLVTVIVLGCYSRSKFRTRNYRVSLWHYLMASAETSTHVTCVSSENHNGTVSPKKEIAMEAESKKIGESENAVTQETTSNDTPETETETNHGESEGIETTPESTENPQDATTLETQAEHDTAATQSAKDPLETPQDKEEPMSTTADESGAQNDPNEVVEKPTDSKNSSESSGEWKTVESKKSPKKAAKKEEKAAKKEEKVAKREGLRMNKVRLQNEWEGFVSSLSKELQQMMGGYWATEDTERYLEGYPNAKDHKDYNLNLEFYQNLLPSSPSGDLVESIHKEWFGAYDHLEQHHGYIQWLFPIQEQGLNHMAQPLQKHEIKLLEKDDKAMNRLINSYELMLDFFGMKLVDKVTGEIGRSDNDSQSKQYKLLNYSFHNYLRITRILKCLGEFRFGHYQSPFCTFVISEIFEQGELKNTLKSCISYWGKVIKNFESRKEFYLTVDGYVKADLVKKGGVVKKELHKYF